MADQRAEIPVQGPLRPAPRRGPQGRPPAVRPPARAGPALRLPRLRRATRRREVHARLLPARIGPARGQRHAAAAFRGSHPARPGTPRNRGDQRAVSTPQPVHRNHLAECLPRRPRRPDRDFPDHGASTGHRRRARGNHPSHPRRSRTHRRRLPPRPQGHGVLPRTPPLAGRPACPNAPLRRARPLYSGVRAHRRPDAARPVPHLYRRRAHDHGDGESPPPARRVHQ